MMAPENRGTMQQGLEASLGCFQPKSFIYGPPLPRSFSGHTPEFKHTNIVKQVNCELNGDGAVSHDKVAMPSQSCGRQVRQENYYVFSTLSPNFQKDVHSQSQLPDGCYYPANNGHLHAQWIPQLPLLLPIAPQSYTSDYVYQEFQYFVVIDFEATCDKDRNPHPQEIIEFPSVLVNSRTGQLEDCFQMYVRPTHNKTLTEFCKELTGIQQSQVDKGVLLSEALLMHDKWLADKGIKNFAVVTWSNWDCRVMLESECRYKRISKPQYFDSWINLKVPFNQIYGAGRRNLKEAVELAGLTWEGRAHCGLDDARNTARLVAHLMQVGYKLAITSHLKWEAADYPIALHQQQQIPTPESNLTYQSAKWKDVPPMFLFPFQYFQAVNPNVYCHCGATSVKRIFQKPGPKHGCIFFGCGLFSANRGPVCNFLKWIPSDSAKPA